MSNDGSNGEIGHQFQQNDQGLARAAADQFNNELADPNSLVTKKVSDQSFQLGFLEKAEQEIIKERSNKHLAELGILSRPETEDILVREAKKIMGGRPGAAEGFVVMYLDGDGFHEINESLGHDEADGYVYSMAKEIKESVRETDWVGRPHDQGDELVVLSPMNVSSQEEAEKYMQISRNSNGESRPGIVASIRGKAEKLRSIYRESNPKWPADRPNKNPGQVSIGWHFFTAEKYKNRYEEFLASEKPGKAFLGFVTKEAEANMYNMKNSRAPEPKENS